MTCPLEKKMVALLTKHAIDFRRPDRDKDDPTTLDFFLPDFALYVEVKQFHSPRISDQLAKVPQRTSAIVLMGPTAVEDFERLCVTIGT